MRVCPAFDNNILDICPTKCTFSTIGGVTPLHTPNIYDPVYDVQIHFQKFMWANTTWMEGHIWPVVISIDTLALHKCQKIINISHEIFKSNK